MNDDPLRDVGEHRAEHRHVEQPCQPIDARRPAPAADAMANQMISMMARPDERAGDHGEMRRLVGPMRDREPAREIARPRQRIDLAALGVDDRVEAGDQADHRDERQDHDARCRRRSRGSRRAAARARLPSANEPTPATEGFSSRIMKAETISVNMPRMMPFGMSRLGSTDSSAASGNCSIARNSQTAKGSVGEHAGDAEREERAVALRQLDRLPSGPDADVQRPAREVHAAGRR